MNRSRGPSQLLIPPCRACGISLSPFGHTFGIPLHGPVLTQKPMELACLVLTAADIQEAHAASQPSDQRWPRLRDRARLGLTVPEAAPLGDFEIENSAQIARCDLCHPEGAREDKKGAQHRVHARLRAPISCATQSQTSAWLGS